MTPQLTNPQKWLNTLSTVFENLEKPILEEILTKGEISNFRPGEKVFKQGDIENKFYIVLSGRFRAIKETGNELSILGDITTGEPVGEFAFFTNDPRSASVYAMRPSVTLELSQDAYLKIVTIEPQFAQRLTTLIANRYKSNSLQEKIKDAPKNIAVINLQEDTDISPWTNLIEDELKTKQIGFQFHNQASLQNNNYQTFFEELESSDDIKFLICDTAHPDWSKQCYIYADLVIIAAEFNSNSKIQSIEKELKLHEGNILSKKVYLLLLHQDKATKAVNTRKWFENRKLDLHIHFPKTPVAAAKFCRIITNQAVGVVLGGGGAKGFAHLGALKALHDARVPIDFVGGTSAGALYGIATVNFDFDFEAIYQHTEETIRKKLTTRDLTYPIMSILSGKKIKKYLSEFYNQTHIEDMWTNTFCITSNLSSSKLSFHNSGLASQKILASIAIPGVFPPVIIDQHLHVDGGVMDNLPIKSMYQYPVGKIIAISLSSIKTKSCQLSEIPTARELLLNKILKRKKYRLPSITSIIMNSLTLNSVQKQEENKSKASLYCELNLKGFGLMDDSKWKLIMQNGFDQTIEFLSMMKNDQKFW